MFTRTLTCAKALGAGVAAVLLVAGPAQADYPERPITLIVPWSAGGGTDAVGRQLAQGLEEELGQPVNVVNRTGGGGVIGHTHMINAEADGYTLGLATAEITTYQAMGLSQISADDMTPIAQVNLDAAAFNVNAESGWKDLSAALDAIRNNPNEYTVSGSAPGAAYHLAFAGFLNQQGIDPTSVSLVPSEGAAPAFQELAAGGVDIVFSSLPEAQSMREAGRVRTLAVFSDERLEAFPNVPTAGEITGEEWAAGTWRGIVGPEGLSDEIVQTVSQATREVWESERFQDFMSKRGFGTRWAGPDEFGAFMQQATENNREIIEKLDLAR